MTTSAATDPTIKALVDRMDVAEARLAGLSREPYPPGRTDPDPGAEETWDAARVWAHTAEFVTYWPDQVRDILKAAPDQPARFGRMKTDVSRTDPIEQDRLLPRDMLWKKAHDGIEQARAWLLTVDPADLSRTGVHPVRGNVTCGWVIEAFVVKHLEEHADQLEKLAAEGREGASTAG